MHFTHIFLFTVTSKSSIDINAISIFNNQQCVNHKDITIIKISLFVNNLACFTAYLANANFPTNKNMINHNIILSLS